MQGELVYRSRLTAIFLIPLGLYCLGLAAFIPFATKAPWLGFCLMGLPLTFAGIIATLNGLASAAARIKISEKCLEIAAPTWRGSPLPPLNRINVSWDMVLAVRHRRELYTIFLAVPFPLFAPFAVDAYAIETGQGHIMLAGRSIPKLKEAIQEVARRSGRDITDEGDVQVRLFRALIRGVPPW